MDKITEELHDVEKDLTVHEAVCAERYKNIVERQEWAYNRIIKIEKMIYMIFVFILLSNPEFLKILLKLI